MGFDETLDQVFLSHSSFTRCAYGLCEYVNKKFSALLDNERKKEVMAPGDFRNPLGSKDPTPEVLTTQGVRRPFFMVLPKV